MAQMKRLQQWLNDYISVNVAAINLGVDIPSERMNVLLDEAADILQSIVKEL